MKSLDQWEDHMSALFDKVNSDDMDLKKAAELSNICGKALKAHQLKLAREIFEDGRFKKAKPLPGSDDLKPTFPSAPQLIKGAKS